MLREVFGRLLDIIYPKICLICKKNLKNIQAIDNFICLECWRKIKRNLPPFCYCCGRHLDSKYFSKHTCPDCARRRLHFDRAFSPCVYDGVIKELIHEFKYKGKDYIGRILSSLMIEFIKEYNLPMDYLDFIVPMPLHKTRLREREFNQAEVLSNYIAEEFKKKVLTNHLIRNRATKTQVELEENQRLLNVKDSFLVKEKEYVKGKNLLLVDDVLTTAASSSEAALALKEAGANIVFVLTLAN
jgi:ComF family protein